MRLLHTADWHLGRTLAGASFLPDQAALLHGAFLELLRDSRPDALIIAGDVFDRAIPPVEAVELLDSVLHEVVLGLRIPAILIPGNHDAAERLSFGARLMQGAGLHIAHAPLGAPIRLPDAHGEVWVLPSGYASPLLMAELLGEGVACHDSGFAAICRQMQGMVPPGARSVVVAHAFLQDGMEAGSERALQVGGAKPVSCAHFASFHYVALGHLHRAQALGPGGRIRYSGSPLAYSFEEAEHQKSVTLVEIDAAGGVTCEHLPLTPPRALRTLEGGLQALLDAAQPAWREDWIRVRLTDAGPVWDPMARLRDAYPNVLELDFARHAALEAAAGNAEAPRRAAAADPLAVAMEFWADMRQRPLPDAARAPLRDAIEAAVATEGAG
jgi:exonuclease SbcD